MPAARGFLFDFPAEQAAERARPLSVAICPTFPAEQAAERWDKGPALGMGAFPAEQAAERGAPL